MSKQLNPSDNLNQIVRYELKDAEKSFGVEVWLDFNPTLCTVCGWCIDVCPESVFSYDLNKEEEDGIDERKLIINIERCLPCGNCIDVCKPAAIVDISFRHI